MDIHDKMRLTDNNAREIIKSICKIDHAIDIQKFDINKRNSYIKNLKEEYRLIERLTGINTGIIKRV